VSILKRKLKKEEEGDELEKILNELKNEQEDRDDVATVTIQIAGLKELVKAVERLADALKKCGEQ
jgi:Ribonuclease G/E